MLSRLNFRRCAAPAAASLCRLRGAPGLAAAAVPRRSLPVCTVQTTQPRAALPKDFNLALSRVIADTLNKPEKLVSVSLTTEVEIVRAAGDQPNAIVHLWSVGVFDVQRNPAYVKALFDYLIPALGMPHHRIALFLHPLRLEDAGHLTYAKMIQND